MPPTDDMSSRHPGLYYSPPITSHLTFSLPIIFIFNELDIPLRSDRAIGTARAPIIACSGSPFKEPPMSTS